jgi:hypothetical protein
VSRSAATRSARHSKARPRRWAQHSLRRRHLWTGSRACTALRGEPERAARLLGAADAARTSIGEPVQVNDRADYERFVSAAWAGLNEDSFKRAWVEGARLLLEQAIELALGRSPA